MSKALPNSVRQAWGEKVSEDFAHWFGEAVRDVAVPRDEYREVLSRLDVLESEVSGVNNRLDRVDERLNQIDARFDQRLDQMQQQTNDRFDRMNERFDRLHEQMRVMMRGTIGTIALIGVILSALLSIAEFAG